MNQSEGGGGWRREGPTRVFPWRLAVCDATQGPEVAHSPVHLPRCVWREPIKKEMPRKKGPIRGEDGDSEWTTGESWEEMRSGVSWFISWHTECWLRIVWSCLSLMSLCRKPEVISGDWISTVSQFSNLMFRSKPATRGSQLWAYWFLLKTCTCLKTHSWCLKVQ